MTSESEKAIAEWQPMLAYYRQFPRVSSMMRQSREEIRKEAQKRVNHLVDQGLARLNQDKGN